MTFNEILKELSVKYELAPKACNFTEILVNKAFDVYNYYFIALKNDNGNIYLTDCANTLECVNISKDDVVKILKDYPTASLLDETIILPYNNIFSVEEFIEILDKISKINKDN